MVPNTQKTISIIVPVYNEHSTLNIIAECLTKTIRDLDLNSVVSG